MTLEPSCRTAAQSAQTLATCSCRTLQQVRGVCAPATGFGPGGAARRRVFCVIAGRHSRAAHALCIQQHCSPVRSHTCSCVPHHCCRPAAAATHCLRACGAAGSSARQQQDPQQHSRQARVIAMAAASFPTSICHQLLNPLTTTLHDG